MAWPKSSHLMLMLSVPLAQSSVADLHDLTLYSNSNPMPAESALNILYQVALFWLQDDSRSHSFLAKTREIRYSPTEGNGSNILNALYGSLLSLFLKKRAERQLLIEAEGSGNKFLRSNEAVVLKSLNMWFSCHVQDEVRLGPTWAAHLPAPRDFPWPFCQFVATQPSEQEPRAYRGLVSLRAWNRATALTQRDEGWKNLKSHKQ